MRTDPGEKRVKKVSRNASCYCGSGKKYKNCHGEKPPGGLLSTQGIYLLLGVIVVAAGVAILSRFSDDPSASRRPITPQPGSAPSGKVWSPEHGHWHDAPGTANPNAAGGQVGGISSQPPPRPAPPGKVWSPEHGQGHDAAPTQQEVGPPFPQPPGPVPDGKVWSSEHGHWHDAQQQQ